MKGIVFAEFLEMVESEFGFVIADKISSLAHLESDGAYSAVGNYPHNDLIEMIGSLSETVGLEKSDLVRSFGRYLFRSFTRNNKSFFKGVDDAYEFLNGIETVIHTEVKKLYKDAKPPIFDCCRVDERQMVLVYRSLRPFADLAEGLIMESLEYFGDEASLSRSEGPTGDACSARFILKR